MEAIRVHIEGIVQGLGFRPYIYRLANTLKLKGWVNNSSDGLKIHIEGKSVNTHQFVKQIQNKPPQLAQIIHFKTFLTEPTGYKDFNIIDSESSSSKTVLISPDFAICDKCREEIHDIKNRRKDYAFTTCTKCGPRYSIISSVPYDRENTSMSEFVMCTCCKEEYEDVLDRRYYSQTNSCDQCGVQMSYYQNGKKQSLTQDEIIKTCVHELREGKIIAVKGIGGFLLLCDAENVNAIDKLRKRKARPSKPFALIYPSIEALAGDVEINQFQRELYNSPAAPIVLFKLKNGLKSRLKTSKIAPGLNHIGVMKPYAPLLELIVCQVDKAMIATSANLSGSSIIYENDEAIRGLNGIADSILCHDRDILVPEDDSVIKLSSEYSRKIILRRSRGYAPNYFGSKQISNEKILAFGASLKSSFTLSGKDILYISQYLGDLDSYDAQLNYVMCLKNLLRVTEFNPEVLLCDSHPNYESTLLAEKKSKEENIALYRIQHHKAHFAAVLAENDLLDSREAILGVVWDGTGFGGDKNIWGGEFFSYRNHEIRRIDHFDYYPHILGDKMPREPRISALAILYKSSMSSYLRDKFENREWEIFNARLKKKSILKTSSAGRVFDAAASILGLGDKVNYEGEAALKLEELALTCKNPQVRLIKGDWLNPQTLLESLLIDLSSGVPKEKIAFDFHLKLATTVYHTLSRYNYKNAAYSGGVFQNGLLVDLIQSLCGQIANLYFHKELSPSDECISFGQVAYYLNEKSLKSLDFDIKERQNKS